MRRTNGGGRGFGGQGQIGDQVQLECWECGHPHYKRDCPKYQVGLRKQGHQEKGEKPQTQHQIHAIVNHRQDEHQATVLESANSQGGNPSSRTIMYTRPSGLLT